VDHDWYTANQLGYQAIKADLADATAITKLHTGKKQTAVAIGTEAGPDEVGCLKSDYAKQQSNSSCSAWKPSCLPGKCLPVPRLTYFSYQKLPEASRSRSARRRFVEIRYAR
jgi:hypothetical protein